MGYYINIDESNVVLTEENQSQILQRWKDLNSPSNNHLKRGGSWSEGKQVATWYSWLDQNYDKTVEDCAEMLEMLGFDFETQDNGDIHVTGYDRKTGQEDLFFKAISDLIPAGQYIHWRGEDGETYSWVFAQNKMLEVDTKEAMKIARKLLTEAVVKTTEVKQPVITNNETKESEPKKKNGRYVL
jgi:hypothetical protein